MRRRFRHVHCPRLLYIPLHGFLLGSQGWLCYPVMSKSLVQVVTIESGNISARAGFYSWHVTETPCVNERKFPAALKFVQYHMSQ